MLKLNNISKSYPQRGIVLDKLSLEVAKGEALAITGPSGSGKTTLLNLIGILDLPDTGSIIYNDDDLSGLNANQTAEFRRDNIGFVFQDHLLLPHLTILENIYLPLLANPKQKSDKSTHNEYINKLLERTGINDIIDKFPAQISGGEAQRAALIRALVNRPAMLLADEPTGSLDGRNADELGNLLLDINRELETTIIAVTHSLDLAEKLGKSLRLESGKLV